MKKKVVPAFVAVILIIIVAAVGLISKIIERYTPSKEVMSAVEYYGAGEGLALIMQDELSTYRGLIENGIPYLEYDAVKEYLNDRFYWDSQGNLLVYTTPTEIIHVTAGEQAYSISGNVNNTDYVIVKTEGEKVYLAAPFIQQYTNMEYTLYEEPDRLLITYKWGEMTCAELTGNAVMRYEDSIKSPILSELEQGTKVTVLEQMEDWSRAATVDGCIGYIQNKSLGEMYQESSSREFEEPVYTSIRKDYKINLVWHQVTSMEANENLLNDIAEMKGVNTISPTWFSISNNEGDITSLASEDYVREAHNRGLEVWGLVDNFSTEISTTTVLSASASRERISDQLVAAALQYDLDGLNIDFEAIPEEAGEGYIQFLREISVKCRNNGIVLSVDDPVPMPFTAHYDRAEQGIVVDYVMVMGYDEHYVGSETAGSVASLSFVRTGIEDTLKEVPAEKVINGVPFYTRLWHTDAQGNVTSEALGMNTSEQWVSDNGLTANWSEETSQDYAEMQTSEGGLYQIWLENEKSLEEKAKLVQEYGLGGIAAWKLGFERPSIWDVLYKYVS